MHPHLIIEDLSDHLPILVIIRDLELKVPPTILRLDVGI